MVHAPVWYSETIKKKIQIRGSRRYTSFSYDSNDDDSANNNNYNSKNQRKAAVQLVWRDKKIQTLVRLWERHKRKKVFFFK